MEKDHKSAWGVVGILLLPLLCCGGPLLLALLGTTSLGAVFAGAGKDWLLGGALAVLAILAGVVLVRRMRHRTSCAVDGMKVMKKEFREQHRKVAPSRPMGMDCCAPPPNAPEQTKFGR